MPTKNLKTTLIIGGAISGSLKGALSTARGGLKGIGDEIAKVDRRQKLLGQGINTFGRMGKNVDGLRVQYGALELQANKLRIAQQRLTSVQTRIDSNNARRQQLGGQLRGAVGGALAVGLPMMAAVRSGAEFDRASTLIGNTANMTATQVRFMNNAILGTSAATNQMAGDVQHAMGTLVAAGLGAGRAQSALKPIGKAATAAGADIDDIARASFTLMDSLKIKPTQLGRALDILYVAGKEGNVELKDMAKTLPVLGASFVALKMGGTEAAATMGAALEIARKGAGDADEASNNMRNYMAKLLSPDTLKKAKKNFNLDLYKVIQDAQTNGQNPFEASMRSIMKATAGDQKKIGQLFADMQVQNFLRPMIQNWGEYGRIKDKAMNGSAGAIDNDFAKMMNTNAERMKKLRGSVDRFGKTLGMTLAPQAEESASKLGLMVDRASLFVAEHPRLVGAIARVTIGLIGMRIAALGAGYAMATLKGPFLGASRAMAMFRAERVIASLGGVGPAASIAATGLRLIGAAVAGIGLGTIGLAVGALVVGGLAVRRYWEPISAWLGGFFDGLSASVGPAMAKIGDSLAPLKPAWDTLSNAIGTAVGWMFKLLEPVRLTPGEFDKATTSGEKFGTVVGGSLSILLGKLKEITTTIGWIGANWKLVSGAGEVLMPGTITQGVAKIVSWGRDGNKPASASVAGKHAPRVARIGAVKIASQPSRLLNGAAPSGRQPPAIAQRSAGGFSDHSTTNIHLTQLPGESSEALARRVSREQERRKAISRRGRLADA